MIRLSLPWPPTANNMYPTGRNGRRFLSNAGRAYHAEVAALVFEQLRCRPRLTGRLHVTIALNPPDARRRDVMNSEKAISDALTKAGVWIDDCQIDHMEVIRDDRLAGGRAVVMIEELPRERAA